MMTLADILEDVSIVKVKGDLEKSISGVQINSQKITAGSLFVAIKGTKTDGHKFIENAIQNGAVAVICTQLPGELNDGVTYVQVADTAMTAAIAAHNFYGRPSEKIALIGVTGTNGKTTCVTLMHDVFTALGLKAGLISTVECRVGIDVLPSTHTTPDPIGLNELLAAMVSAECAFAFMEVSSHAIDQKRIGGLQFTGAVFTNITHDHLDYHGTFQRYLDTKKKLFDGLGAQAFALINADDPRSDVMVQNTEAKVSKYSLYKLADFRSRILGNHIEGLHLRIDEVEMMSRLVGDFNAQNLTAVYAVAILMGLDKQDVITALSNVSPAEGRFDIVRQRGGKSAIVDYAHTPDALKKVLGTIRQVKSANSRLIVVVGCGGDRDKAKRPVMGSIAASLADSAILTSDNPRTEDPEQILRDMEKGVPDERRPVVLTITNRREAIRAAVKTAGQNDIILIAGKGHEKYQEINGVKHPFDDKEIVRNALLEDI